MKALIGAFASVALVGAASAQVSGFSTELVDNSAALTGFVTNDISVDFAGQLSGVQILTNLTSGSIFQQPVLEGGGDTAPNPGFFGVFPAVEFDSFVSLGGRDVVSADAVPGFAGGAVNLGGANARTFSDSLIDVAFFPEGGLLILDQTGYFVSRLTFSDDANGEISLIASTGNAADAPPVTLPVVDGVIVPEPATAALLGLGGLAMLRRRSA